MSGGPDSVDHRHPMERAMPDMTLVLIAGGTVVAVLLTIASAILGRIKSATRLLLSERFASLQRAQDRIERSIRDEIARDREERATIAKELREELRAGTKDSTDSTGRMLELFGVRLDALTSGVDRRLASLQTTVDDRLGGFQ